jgi:4-hydroxybenzoate polyprenyltransferase
MNSSSPGLKDYLQAVRPQKKTIDLQVFELLLLGFLLNSTASIHNNITDFSYDLKVKYTSDRVVGTRIPMHRARAVYAALLLISLTLGAFLAGFDPLDFRPSWWALLALLFTAGIVSAYNLFGKTHFIWGICISLGIASLVWYGAILSGSMSDVAIFIIVYLALQSGFMQNLEGGLKDVATDLSNMAASLGVRSDGKALHVSIMTALLVYMLYSTVGLLHPAAIFIYILTALSFIVIQLLLNMKTFDRGRIIRFFGYHEALMWLMLAALIAPIIGIWPALFVALLPLVFYVIYNRSVHGTMLVPDI